MHFARFIALSLIFGWFCEDAVITTASPQSPIITVIANATNINITLFRHNVAIAVNTGINRIQVLSNNIYYDAYTYMNITFIFTQLTIAEISRNEKTSVALTVVFQLYFSNRYDQQNYNDLFGSFLINDVEVGAFFTETTTQTSKPIQTIKPITRLNITNINVTNIDQPEQDNNTMYIIIICCVIGGVAFILLGIFLGKKYIVKKKYNNNKGIRYGGRI
jgi:hypothetical protein